MSDQKKLKVYYDGSCQVCSREMSHYRERDQLHALDFIDITAPTFEAHLHGKTSKEFMARLHVRDAEGRFHTGVDAFAAIWRTLPGEHLDWLARFVQAPVINTAASIGYEVFAFVRPWLPKNRDTCTGGSCHWRPPQSSH